MMEDGRKKLKTVAEHNLEVLRIHNNDGRDMNGIACPLCESECYNSGGSMVRLSYPAQKHISCSKCLWTDYVYTI